MKGNEKMSEWKTIEANSNLIQHDTGKAVLIKVPNSEFKFWHPAKCVRTSGKSGYRLSISYTDSFDFKLFRSGKGRYNKSEKIEEKTVTSSELESMFGYEG